MRVLQSWGAAWPVFGAAMLGIALFGAWTSLPRPEAPVTLAPPFLLPGAALPRCPSCGWIEAKREIEPDATDPSAPKTYEYTLRMADGSVRLFRETMPTKWHLRERMVLIEAVSPLD